MTKEQRQYDGAKIVFLTNGIGTTGYPHAKKDLDTDLTPFIKINSKWITDLNVKHKTIKLLDDNVRENLDDPGYSDDFLDTTPTAPSMKEKIDKLDFIKIKNFCSAKDNVKRMRRQATEWKKIFAKDTSDKGLLSKIYKELLKLNKKTNDPIKNGQKNLIDTSPKKIHPNVNYGL